MTSRYLLACACASALAAETLEPLGSVADAFFFEGFDADWSSRWIVSKDSEFTGTWKHELYSDPEGIVGDKGIVVGDEARKHALSTVFSEPLDPKGTGFVVQYELQMKKALQCGGAYLKVLSASDELSADGFTNASPYTVMFGPDKCGSTNKVHFIVRHKSPVTGEFEEKHIKSPPVPKLNVNETHLYTAIIGSDNTVRLLIDNKEVKKADLLSDSDFDPPVNPPKELDDPEDSKPEDWVDDAKIDDPAASKPEDWDEDAPRKISDPDATKPAEWLDDAPLEVPDPNVAVPDDWDEEEDGEFEAPLVKNPACKPPAGCGEWSAPQIANPLYKGKWLAPKIDNPAYVGVWAPRKMANPNFFHDEQPHAMTPIGGIGIELWTMQSGALFDNILIATDPAVAAAAAEASFVKREAAVTAKKAEAAAAKKAEEEAKKAEEEAKKAEEAEEEATPEEAEAAEGAEPAEEKKDEL
eukprot:CAMPEP_0119361492 /NCGR_PEP_ID=MMETSP1334-20130426/8778_1 /TAXON_ID=127549 /ORGANISM="Calcidiscus leptoporus, Strain RCC1130" /LENGTH=468 /DNA_ID=CAMNT_0007376515 /DNA_START=13 /DNA_END=1419 /DNA_ORIENTATION=-